MTNPAPTPAPEHSLKVISWNLMHTGGDSIAARTREAAAQLKLQHPDILLVQEARVDDELDVPAELAEALGMVVAARGTSKDDNHHGADAPIARSTVAVLTRLDVVRGETVVYPSKPVSEYAFAELVAPSGRHVLVVSAHLSWGSHNEPARLRQAVDVDAHIREEHDRLTAAGIPVIAVLGGDFNAVPQSETYRYLAGHAVVNDQSTLWVDAWELAGDGAGWTSNPNATVWGRETAARVGITRPELLPLRRIDFVFVFGWAYGRPGCPLTASVFGDVPMNDVHASDHWGVAVDIDDPAL